MRITRRIPSSADYGLLELTNPSGLRIQLLPDGTLFALRHGPTLINQIIPTPAERGMHRLVLRVHEAEASSIVDLTSAAAAFGKVDQSKFAWTGATEHCEHTATLTLDREQATWLWEVRVRNVSTRVLAFDVLYGQDLGLADEAAVRGNEAFISQYIDHCPVSHPRWGTVLLSRRNMAQSGGAHPWIAHACLTGSGAWATDGFQFFGLPQRTDGEPAAYRSGLPGKRLQYEFAYAALQTPTITLPAGAAWETAFLAAYTPDHASASGQADLDELEQRLHAFAPVADSTAIPLSARRTSPCVFDAPPLEAEHLSDDEWARLFPGEWRHAERDDTGDLLSFFHANARHVVSRRKEAKAERPHGHLLRTGGELWPADRALGTTVYASGVFNAQVFLGNTNLARCLSVVRNSLDAMASSGQRVFARNARSPAWRRLGVPSAFEIGLDEVRWLYRVGENLLEARTRVDPSLPRVSFSLHVLAGGPWEFLVTHLLVLGEREMDQPFTMSLDPATARIECAPDANTLLGEKWPGLRFAISATDPEKVAACGGDELLYADGSSRGAPYAVLQSRAVTEFAVAMEGWAPEEPPSGSPRDEQATSCSAQLLLGLPELRHPRAVHVAETLPWFAHNAWMHFAAPRGLEQYGGAAWGVRDVCQGPIEWLLATRRFAAVRRALLQVFSQQYEGSGCWPQWFMFAPFRFQSVHAHGDVPFWPVKALADYVEAANDFSVLDEEVPYTDSATFACAGRRETLLRHALRVVDVFESRRIPGTALVNYGDGDWDDTLQPADPSLRSVMVSAWTAALAHHAFRLLHRVCVRAARTHEADVLAALVPRIQADFQRHLLPDGVLAGFLVFGEGAPRPLLHPRDRVTGIRYRLLPMTRAVLAGLFSVEQAKRHFDLIRSYLLFPDGVRLMSDPVPYRGGAERWFKRAETAANFGREIGLMYTHAHLRYVEALVKLGRADEAWEMLGRITPVALRERVPNAAPRQANAFFSSSDAAFADRYEAAARFDELRTGSIAVKGGWRVYSSGPGLYVNRIVQGLLGLSDSFGDIVLDPVLPRELDGLVATIERDGRKIEIRYTRGPLGYRVDGIRLNGAKLPTDRREPNPYREGGVRLDASIFASRLRDGVNILQIVTA